MKLLTIIQRRGKKRIALHSYRRSCSDAEAKRGQTLRSAVHQRSLNFLITKHLNSWLLITKHLEDAFQLPEIGIIIISCVDNAPTSESDFCQEGNAYISLCLLYKRVKPT